MKAFQDAIEAWDIDTATDLLADDVVFRTVAFKPYVGKPIVAAILRGVSRVLTDFRYVKTIEEGAESALVFMAMVGDLEVNGCDFLTVNSEGKISEFTVMLRPLKAANALAEAMGAQFPQIQSEAIAAMTAGADQ